MITSRLRDFIAKAERKGRITFGDVKRLQRNVLPDGIAEREELELLLALERKIGRADATFADWLVAAAADFVVWGERPTGVVAAAARRWLEALVCALPPTRTGLRILREVTREAAFAEPQGEDEAPAFPRGSVTTNSVNSPGALATSIAPPCCLTTMS